ncbi:RNA methyltransferase [Succinimonas amylolytica]|uniref:RNA methyltransferase n=1 Tax=Succinimonas amylolytica TaxID=83769 RepID=UPI00036BD8B9|nr:RNA methyltransferase [Succinimonas amylolytica]
MSEIIKEQNARDSLSPDSRKLLNLVRVVLVEPTHPGNIGSAARAMKTMGLSRLTVVTDRPVVTPESEALSGGAFDVVQEITVVSSLDEALRDVSFAAGTSARLRTLDRPLYQPREGLSRVLSHTGNGEETALVFGRESSGLSNAELSRCDIHINIDASPEYSSLNLAMSVQVLAYELRQLLLRSEHGETGNSGFREEPLKPAHRQWESFYAFLEDSLRESGFIKPDVNGTIMEQLRHIMGKADLTNHELQILYGVMASLKRH